MSYKSLFPRLINSLRLRILFYLVSTAVFSVALFMGLEFAFWQNGQEALSVTDMRLIFLLLTVLMSLIILGFWRILSLNITTYTTEIETRERRYSRFLSHQLRSSLNYLYADAEALIVEQTAPVNIKRFEERTSEITDQLDTLLHIARGKKINLQPLAMTPLMMSFADTLLAVEKKRITFETKAKPVFLGDNGCFREMMKNILDNALKYTSGPIIVKAYDAPNEDCVFVDIIDHGDGLPEKPNSLKGERFGLQIVDEIAQITEARVSFIKLNPQGLTVRISLPKYQPYYERIETFEPSLEDTYAF